MESSESGGRLPPARPFTGRAPSPRKTPPRGGFC